MKLKARKKPKKLDLGLDKTVGTPKRGFPFGRGPDSKQRK